MRKRRRSHAARQKTENENGKTKNVKGIRLSAIAGAGCLLCLRGLRAGGGAACAAVRRRRIAGDHVGGAGASDELARAATGRVCPGRLPGDSGRRCLRRSDCHSGRLSGHWLRRCPRCRRRAPGNRARCRCPGRSWRRRRCWGGLSARCPEYRSRCCRNRSRRRCRRSWRSR